MAYQCWTGAPSTTDDETAWVSDFSSGGFGSPKVVMVGSTTRDKTYALSVRAVRDLS